MELKSIVNFGLVCVILIGGMGLFAPAQPVHAAGMWYVASGGSDAADCASPASPCATINGAIGKAAVGDTIRVAVGYYYYTTGSYVVTIQKSLELSGGWNAAFTEQIYFSVIDGQNLHNGLAINASSTIVSIDRFIIQNGKGPSYAAGGGVSNGGDLTITNSLIIHNSSGNSGGGINTLGPLTIKNSSINDNFTSTQGGGILRYTNAPMYISNSTIAGNSAQIGGGIYSFYSLTAAIYLDNVTITDNTVTNEAGGIESGVPVYMRNSILAGNRGPSYSQDCGGSRITSYGYNLIQNTSGCIIDGDLTGNLTDVDPHLFAPVNVLGFYPLGSSSPAIDAGNPAGCRDAQNNLLIIDQRGFGRAGRCDMGAYEYTAPGPAASLKVTGGSPQTTGIGQPFPQGLQVRALDAWDIPVDGAEINFSAPLSGASGTFQENGAASITTATDEGGYASPAFKANDMLGTYTVSATTSGVSIPADLILTNDWLQIFLPMLAKPILDRIVDIYPFSGRCADINLEGNGQVVAIVTQCVTQVRLREDGEMYFDVQWSVRFLSPAVNYVYKLSDVGNTKVYVTDSLGNRYDHLEVGGAAAQVVYFYQVGGPYSAEGWYLIPPALPGATDFTFHDDDQGIVIRNITLIH